MAAQSPKLRLIQHGGRGRGSWLEDEAVPDRRVAQGGAIAKGEEGGSTMAYGRCICGQQPPHLLPPKIWMRTTLTRAAMAQPCYYSTMCRAPLSGRRSWPGIGRKKQQSSPRRRQPRSPHLRCEQGMEDEGERKNGVYLGFSTHGTNRIRRKRRLCTRGVRRPATSGEVFYGVEAGVESRPSGGSGGGGFRAALPSGGGGGGGSVAAHPCGDGW